MPLSAHRLDAGDLPQHGTYALRLALRGLAPRSERLVSEQLVSERLVSEQLSRYPASPAPVRRRDQARDLEVAHRR